MSLEPSSAELATRRATARAIRERRNSIRACYGSASWKANRSFRPLQASVPPSSTSFPLDPGGSVRRLRDTTASRCAPESGRFSGSMAAEAKSSDSQGQPSVGLLRIRRG